MYNQFFQFHEAPFSISPNPRFLYMSARHQEALAHLLYGIDNGGGFVALTGEIGTGKTTLCRSLLESLPEHVEVALILNPKLNSLELLATICDELAIAYPDSEQSLKVLIDRLNEYLLKSHSQGQRTVLIIDEAQNLSLEVLEQIRLLTNLETSEIKLLQIILVGQPELQQLLNDKKLRQLNQRISARYHLLPLSLAETQKYITHRILVSQGDPRLFTGGAIKKIYKHSKGFPRLINIICDRALLGAYSANTKTITPSIVNIAARETQSVNFTTRKTGRYALLFILLVAVVAAMFYAFELKRISDLSAEDKLANLQSSLPKTKVAVVRPADKKLIPKVKKPSTKVSKPKVAKISNVGRIINDPDLSLDSAMRQMLKIWQKPVAKDTVVNCAYLESTGLRCLSGVSTWQEIKAFNRPVILELAMINGDTRHVFVTKHINNKLELLIKGQRVRFKLNELLAYWQGQFLFAWQPNFSDTEFLFPEMNSKKILWLRKSLQLADGKISANSNRTFFDNELMNRVLAFQKANQLAADGLVGPKTFIHLQNLSTTTAYPTLH